MTYLKLICQNDDAFFVSRQQYEALKRILRPSSFILLNLTERTVQQEPISSSSTARLGANQDEYFPLKVSEACIVRTVPAPRELLDTWFDIFVDNNTTGLLAASIDSKPKFFDLLYVCVLLDVNLSTCKRDVVRVLETATSSFESEATWSLAHDRLSQLFLGGDAGVTKPSSLQSAVAFGSSNFKTARVQPGAPTTAWWPSAIAATARDNMLADSQQTITNNYSNMAVASDGSAVLADEAADDGLYSTTGFFFELDAKRGARYAAFLFQSEIAELRESAQAFLCALVQLYPLTQLARALDNRWPTAVNESLNMSAMRRALCDALLDSEICPYRDEAHLFADLIAFQQGGGDVGSATTPHQAATTDTAAPSSVDFSSQDEREREDLSSVMSVGANRRLSSNSNSFWRGGSATSRRILSTRSHPAKVREALGDARLSKIRFGAIPVHRFEQQIIRTGVLSERECVHLLNALSGNTLHDALEQQQQFNNTKGRPRSWNSNAAASRRRQAAAEEILRHDVHLEQLLSSSTSLSYKPRYYLPANLQDLHCSVSLLQSPSMLILAAAVAAGAMYTSSINPINDVMTRRKNSKYEQQQPPVRLKAVPCTCSHAFFVCKLRLFEALVFGDYLKQPISSSNATIVPAAAADGNSSKQRDTVSRIENAFDDTRQWEVLVKEIQLPQYYLRHGLRVEYRILDSNDEQQKVAPSQHIQAGSTVDGIESNIYTTLPIINRPGTGSSVGSAAAVPTLTTLPAPKGRPPLVFSNNINNRQRHGTDASGQSSWSSVMPSTVHIEQTGGLLNSAAPSSATLAGNAEMSSMRNQQKSAGSSQVWRTAKINHAYSPPALLLRSIRALRRELNATLQQKSTATLLAVPTANEPIVRHKSSSHRSRHSAHDIVLGQETNNLVDSDVVEADNGPPVSPASSSYSSLLTAASSSTTTKAHNENGGGDDDLALCQVSLVNAIRVSVGQELQMRIFFNNESINSTRYAGRLVQRTTMKMGPFNVEKHFVLGDDSSPLRPVDDDYIDGEITASGYVRGECVVASNCGAIPAVPTTYRATKGRHGRQRDGFSNIGIKFGESDNLPPHLLDPLANSEYYGRAICGGTDSTQQLHPSIIDFRLGCLLVQDSLTA